MHDTFLLNNISNSLRDICKENNLSSIEQCTLVVHHNSHVNEANLREYLEEHHKNLISMNITIEVHRENIEEQTAIIKSIKGECLDI